MNEFFYRLFSPYILLAELKRTEDKRLYLRISRRKRFSGEDIDVFLMRGVLRESNDHQFFCFDVESGGFAVWKTGKLFKNLHTNTSLKIQFYVNEIRINNVRYNSENLFTKKGLI
jgi:hypothetical protein